MSADLFIGGTASMVSIEIKWRRVFVNDLVLDRDGEVWRVEAAGPGTCQWKVRLSRGGRSVDANVDPDEVVGVLHPNPDDPAAKPRIVQCPTCAGRGQIRNGDAT